MMKQTFTVAAAETSTISQQGTSILLTIVSSCAAHSRIIILLIAVGNGTESDKKEDPFCTEAA